MLLLLRFQWIDREGGGVRGGTSTPKIQEILWTKKRWLGDKAPEAQEQQCWNNFIAKIVFSRVLLQPILQYFLYLKKIKENRSNIAVSVSKEIFQLRDNLPSILNLPCHFTILWRGTTRKVSLWVSLKSKKEIIFQTVQSCQLYFREQSEDIADKL